MKRPPSNNVRAAVARRDENYCPYCGTRLVYVHRPGNPVQRWWRRLFGLDGAMGCPKCFHGVPVRIKLQLLRERAKRRK